MAPSVQPVGDMQVPSHDVLFYNVSFGEGFLSSFFFFGYPAMKNHLRVRIAEEGLVVRRKGRRVLVKRRCKVVALI